MSSQLSGIEFTLNQLLHRAQALGLEVLAKGKTPKPGDVKTPDFFAKLKTIGDSTALILRSLKSMDHAQGLRADQLHKMPREARYGGRQSIDSQLQNIQRVRALALRLAAELRGVYGVAQTPTTADLIEGAHKVLMEVGKTVDRTQLQSTVRQVNDGPVITAAAPPPGASAVDVLTQVWLLLACVVALTRSDKR